MRAIVTRPARQAGPLVDALREQGFEAVLCPLIEIEAIDDGPIDVDGYDWVVVTSANGAEQLARRRTGALRRIAAVGDATAEALVRFGLRADFVPAEASEEGVAAELPRPAGRVLFVGAEGAGRLLRRDLDAAVRSVYRIRELQPASPPSGDVVLLASPSAARSWARLGVDLPAVTIGGTTTKAAIAAGIAVVGEAQTQDARGLVDSAASWRASSHS
jgi:uroporphyrinogen III methyltransferase/synthase